MKAIAIIISILFFMMTFPQCKNDTKVDKNDTQVDTNLTALYVHNNTIKKILKGRSADNIYSLAFSPNGRLLASGDGDRAVILWDVEKGERLRTLYHYYGDIASVAVSPDGRLLASVSNGPPKHGGYISLWDVVTGEELCSFHGPKILFSSVDFSPDGRLLATGGSEKTIKLWDVAASRKQGVGQRLRTLEGHSAEVNSFAFSKGGRSCRNCLALSHPI